MKRLVCIVEGKGEVKAIPNLCMRILRQYLGDTTWLVDEDPIRQPRGKLVNERERSPLRPCHADGLGRAVELARSRRSDAVLVLCDADDDCPATWGPDAARALQVLMPGDAVMAVREYETWLLLNHEEDAQRRAGAAAAESKRGAKEVLRRLVPGYLPTTHQLSETRKIDISRVRRRSDSFDKLVRALATISGMPLPAR
ncbi:hypothetical protein BE21_31030 [Sorangium cellulosum]|uniref:DUF4276 family protein n=1 Tax=Sorangium cellulosum TaxID=56 RepID=A0A150TR00_SORCE|nr:hypothetical protein BE21_31030 [Sorangium cellulosum]